MARKQARPIITKMVNYHHRTIYGLAQEENISLSQRIGYLARSVNGMRIRHLGNSRGEVWSLDKMRGYAEKLRDDVSDLKVKNFPSGSLRRLEEFLTDLTRVL